MEITPNKLWSGEDSLKSKKINNNGTTVKQEENTIILKGSCLAKTITKPLIHICLDKFLN